MKTIYTIIIFVLFSLSVFAQASFTETSHPGRTLKFENNLYMSDVTIYPNPVIGNTFRIKSDDLIVSVEVMNVVGQNIVQYHNQTFSREDIAIELGNCDKGMYLVKITFENNKALIKKILVK